MPTRWLYDVSVFLCMNSAKSTGTVSLTDIFILYQNIYRSHDSFRIPMLIRVACRNGSYAV